MQAVFDNPVFTRSVRNSLLIATIGGALATLAIAALSVVAHRSSFRFRGSLQYSMLYPRAMPGLVTGMAFFWAFVVLDPSNTVRASLWGIGIAFAVRSLALGYSAFYPALHALGEDIDRAARTSGADWWMTMRSHRVAAAAAGDGGVVHLDVRGDAQRLRPGGVHGDAGDRGDGPDDAQAVGRRARSARSPRWR